MIREIPGFIEGFSFHIEFYLAEGLEIERFGLNAHYVNGLYIRFNAFWILYTLS